MRTRIKAQKELSPFSPEVSVHTSRGYLQVSKLFIKMYGPLEALVLCNLIEKHEYFLDQGKIKGEWFFLVQKEQMEELNLGKAALGTVLRKLAEWGALTTQRRGVPPKNWYHINYRTIVSHTDLQRSGCSTFKGLDAAPIINKPKGNKPKGKRTIPPRRSDGGGPDKKSPANDNAFKRHYLLSEQILIDQNKRHPNLVRDITQKKIDAGASTLEKLERIDRYDFQKDIKPVLLWAVSDSFWSKNFLSCTPLRDKGKNGEKKFTNMYASFERSAGKQKETLTELDRMYDRSFTKPFEDYIGGGSLARTQSLFANLEKIEEYYKGSWELARRGDTAEAYDRMKGWKTMANHYLKFMIERNGFATPSPAVFDIDKSTFWANFIKYCNEMYYCDLNKRK